MYSKEGIKELHLKFWQNFKIYCEKKPALKFKKKRWVLNETRIRGVALRFELDRESAKVILELQHKHEDYPLKVIPKNVISSDCGAPPAKSFNSEKDFLIITSTGSFRL